MLKRKKWTLIQLLGERYVLNILDALLEGSKRFVDLADACPNEKTRTAKLRRLEEAGLIETVSSKIGKRFFVHYQLTEKGKKMLQELIRMEERYSLDEK
jgi:DNA-binding HxlR family transcriptional regulator